MHLGARHQGRPTGPRAPRGGCAWASGSCWDQAPSARPNKESRQHHVLRGLESLSLVPSPADTPTRCHHHRHKTTHHRPGLTTPSSAAPEVTDVQRLCASLPGAPGSAGACGRPRGALCRTDTCGTAPCVTDSGAATANDVVRIRGGEELQPDRCAWVERGAPPLGAVCTRTRARTRVHSP